MVSTIASVAFQVTGINDKINKAASKVFGEDLVGVANIAGLAYGAINGGFDIGGGGAAPPTGASSAGALNGSDIASDMFSTANSAAGGGLASDGMGSIFDATGAPANVIDGLAGANVDASGGGVNGMSSITPDASAGTNLMDPGQPLGIDSKTIVDRAQSSGAEGVASAEAAAPQASGADAASSKASSGQGLKVRAASQAASPPQAVQRAATVQTAGAKPGSFFDKLMNSEKAMGEVIKGVGGGLQSASASKAEKEKLAWMKERYTATPSVRILQ